MNRFFITLMGAMLLASCGNQDQNTEKTTVNKDVQFDQFKERFVNALWKQYPSWASSVGFHNYDSVLTIPNNIEKEASLLFSQKYLDSLQSFDLNALSANNKTDFYLIKNNLESAIWYAKAFDSGSWNPAEYNIGGSFSEILNTNQYAIEDRLKNISIKLKNVGAYYEAAKNNINNPTKEHTALAINQLAGALSVFEIDIPEAAEASKINETEKIIIVERCKNAVVAINGFINFLKALKNENPRPFNIGKDLYFKKFELDIQSKFTAQEIYDRALQRKKELHLKMYEAALALWPKYLGKEKLPNDSLQLIRMMIDKLSINHTHRDSFQSEIDQQIPKLIEFIKQKNLIYIDPSKPLVVRKEPAYMQGVAGASISSPGPYDKNGNTYYNVGTLANYSAAEAESYLREYNDYILQILNIHEAIPGHYTQLVYSNNSPSLIKSLFGNGAMIEGWAVYTELMMLENDYGNNSPEMWLMYYKWHLRSVCNTILDYSIHVNNMSEKEALNLLVNEAFQQEAEAKGKYKRVSLTQVQLCSYFTGFTEIYDLRETLKKKKGNSFNLKQFHEQFLSYGSAPVKYISEAMLAD
jgi:uncharacterized protein (DUF885 family)